MWRCIARRKPAATASRCSAPQYRRARVLDVAQPAQRHRHVELAADDFQHARSEEHTSELQSQFQLVCGLMREKKKDVLQTVNAAYHGSVAAELNQADRRI